jgi:hypothetical protein
MSNQLELEQLEGDQIWERGKIEGRQGRNRDTMTKKSG